jgi:hypothetical protein
LSFSSLFFQTREKVMAGILTDKPKVISAQTHAVIDYVHAGVNFVAAAMFWKRHRAAAIGALALGGSVLANALMTDYPLGVFRLYSFRVHGMLDYGVAAASSVMPEIIRDRRGKAAERFFRIQGMAETGTAAMTDYTDRTGARRPGNRLPSWIEEAA